MPLTSNTIMRSAHSILRLLVCVLLLGFGTLCRAGTDESNPAAIPQQPDRTTFIFAVDAARFEGDFGTDRDVTYDILTSRFRWLSSRLEWRLTVPFLRIDSGVLIVGGVPVPGPGGDGGTEVGLGDVLARGQVWALKGTARRPWVGILGEVKLPTADEEKGLGTGETDFRAGTRIIQNIGRTSLLFDASYTVLGDPDNFDFENIVRIGAGVAQPIGSRHQLFGYLENRTHPIPGRDDRLILMIGDSARFGERRRIRFSATALAGLSDTAADWGLVFSLGRQF